MAGSSPLSAPASLPQPAPAAPAALWEHFAAKAALLGTTVIHAGSEEEAATLLAPAMAGEPPDRSSASATEIVATSQAASRFPRATAAAGRLPAVARGTAREVVGLGQAAVAETGSVLLAEDRAGRAACLLAERLWLLVPYEAIVASLDGIFAHVRRLVQGGMPYVTLMSGPSRTADIERTLTIGVHGPRALTIVVVGGEQTAP